MFLNSGIRTADIAKDGEAKISCTQMGDEVILELQNLLTKWKNWQKFY